MLKNIIMIKKIPLLTLLLIFLLTKSKAQITGMLERFSFNNSYSNSSNTVSFSSNTGTSFVADRNGNTNSALQINNTGTSATIAGLPYGFTARTVSLWVKVNTFNTQSFNFLFNYGTTGTPAYGAYINQTSITNFGSSTNHAQATTIALNEWNHYVFTFERVNNDNNNNRSRIYKNGVLIGSKQLPLNTTNTNNVFRLGLTENGGTNYFSGVVDDLEIYNRALTANEVYQLYGSTAIPVLQWSFTGHLGTLNSTTFPFSTPNGTSLGIDRLGNTNRSLFINNSGSVATGATGLPQGNAARTISFWFKRWQSDFQELFVYGSSGHASCFGLYVTANGSFVNYYTNNGTVYAAMSGSTNQNIPPDSWHYISVVYTQDSSLIYRNGVAIAQMAHNIELATTGTNLLLGKVLTTSQNPFQGNIDEIRVYNGALSASEIAAQYGVEQALPTKLNNFNASVNNQTALLKWSSSNEINTSHFDVEYSTNGKEFERVTTVKAKGNSSDLQHYDASHFIGNQPLNFYRLKMIDKDGLFTYSNILKLENKATRNDFSFTAMPSIGNGKLNANLSSKKQEIVTLQVINLNGVIVYTEKLNVAKGTNSFLVDISNQPKGMYLLKVNSEQGFTMQKIIKQ